MSEYSRALRTLGFPEGVQPTQEELKRCMERDALKILQKPRMSTAYSVLVQYTSSRTPKKAAPPANNWLEQIPLQREQPETPPMKRHRTGSPEPSSPEKVQQHPLVWIFESLDEQLSTLGQTRWAGDMDWNQTSPQAGGDDVTGACYVGNAPLEKLRSCIETRIGEQLTLELLSRVLGLADGLLSAHWMWIAEAPDVLILQNKEVVARAPDRRARFGKELALSLARGKTFRYALSPAPVVELDVVCLDLVALFGAADKFLASCRLLRRPAMPLGEVRKAVHTRTGRVLSQQLLTQLVALSSGVLDFHWARPKFQAPAQLEVAQCGLVNNTQPPGREQLAERLATFQEAIAAAAASGSLPSKEMPSEPTGKVQL